MTIYKDEYTYHKLIINLLNEFANTERHWDFHPPRRGAGPKPDPAGVDTVSFFSEPCFWQCKSETQAPAKGSEKFDLSLISIPISWWSRGLKISENSESYLRS